MAKVSTRADDSIKVSDARAGRLFKLLKVLGKGPCNRVQLLRRLKIGMRTFYRDVELLRGHGVAIETIDAGYALMSSFDDAVNLLPFPDPKLTFGEIMTLMRGRTKAHRKLKQVFERLTK